MRGVVDLTTWPTPAGVLRTYEAVWTPATDAPREYLIASGLSVIATALGNRVYLPFGGTRLFPNDWKILLGPSSTFRKSTCVNYARKTLDWLAMGEGAPSMLFPDEFSKEALVTRLGERAQGLLTYSEFSGALAAFGRDYMGGTKELLADLYDSPAKYERIVGKQTITATNVCIGILAASQTDWLLEKLKETDIRGGFMARFTYWPAFEKRRHLALPPEPAPDRVAQLVEELRRIRQVSGAVSLPGNVARRYSHWLERHESQLDDLASVGKLGPFWARLATTMLKFAVTINASADRAENPLELSESSLASAIGLADYLKDATVRVFEEEMAFTQDMKNRQRILRLIRKRPGLPFRELSRNSSLLKRQLEPVLDTLKAEGLIECRPDGYWPLSDAVA